jgi:CysZ protein
MFISLLAKSFRDLLLPGILRLLLLCLLMYVVGWVALAWIFSTIISAYMGFFGAEGFIMHMLGSFGGVALAWFLFPLLYPILVSFFDDSMAETIERADYPDSPLARPPFWPTLLQDAWFSFKAILLNLLFIPIYFSPIGLVVYYLLNGHLLGTQFYRMAAGRNMSPQDAEKLRNRARGAIFLAGITISVFSTIPVLNLVAPLLGVAVMVHLVHDLQPQSIHLPPR